MQNPFVHRLERLANLQIKDVQFLEEICVKTRNVASKKYILGSSIEISTFLIIIGGWAARHQILKNGGRQITRLMLPGDSYYFNASTESLSNDMIVTLSPCEISHVLYSHIEHAIAGSTSLGSAIRNYEYMENSILSSSIVNIGRRDALERMAYLICELHFRMGLIDGFVEDNQFEFPLTQDDLADVLGLTPVHVNRKLQQLRQSDIISLRARKMQILDLPQLRQLAGFNPSYLAQGHNTEDRRVVSR